MDLKDLTLDEIYDLERKHSALVGCRMNVFLEPDERLTRNQKDVSTSGSETTSEASELESELQRLSGLVRTRRAELSRLEQHVRQKLRKTPPNLHIGDSVRVHTKVVKGDKERIQIFSGVVIGRRGKGDKAYFTVRRISYGEGVERVFAINSPQIDRVVVKRAGGMRRGKLTGAGKRFIRRAISRKGQAAAVGSKHSKSAGKL